MANLSNINNKFLVTTGGNVLIGRTSATGTSKLQVTGSLLIGTDINSGIPLVVQETTADGFAIAFMRNTNSTGGNGLVIDVNSTGGGYIQDWRQASTVKMRLLQNGNLGIGTDSPGTIHGQSYGTTKLHIDGGTDRGQLVIEGDSLAAIAFSDNGTTANERVFYQSVNGGLFNIKPLNDNGTSTASTGISMLHNGNVGIGDTNPSFILDTNITSSRARFKANTGNADIELSSIEGHDWLIRSLSDDSFVIYDEDEASARLVIDSSGITTLTAEGYQLAIKDASSGNISEILTSNTAMGFFADRANAVANTSMIFSIDNSTKMTIDSSGNSTFTGNINIANSTPQLILERTGGSNVNPSGQIIFKENAATEHFQISYNGVNDRLEFKGLISSTMTSLAYLYRNSTTPLSVLGGISAGGEIHIKNGTTTGGKILLSGADNDLKIDGSRGQIQFSINGTNEAVLDSLQFYPQANNGLNLGTTSLRFNTVYASNGVNTSDETLKENIKECDLGIDFIDSLKPKSYKFKDLKEDDGAYGKKRYGLIAQDLLQTELKDSIFGKKDGEYGLSYNDLIAPMIKAIQELKAEIDELKK